MSGLGKHDLPAAAELESTLTQYLVTYNYSPRQRALDHQTLSHALKAWRKTQPDLFVENGHEHAGLSLCAACSNPFNQGGLQPLTVAAVGLQAARAKRSGNKKGKGLTPCLFSARFRGAQPIPTLNPLATEREAHRAQGQAREGQHARLRNGVANVLKLRNGQADFIKADRNQL